MRVCRKKILWRTMNIGEIAASAAGNQDLFPSAFRPLQHGDSPPAFAGFRRAKKASRTRSKNDHIKTPTHSLRHRFCESALLQVWLLDVTENKEVAENTELEKQQEIGAVTSILWQGVGF